MKKTIVKTFIGAFLAVMSISIVVVSPVSALILADSGEHPVPGPDNFEGDTAIYTLRAADVPINVMFLIDNSASAANLAAGEAYNYATPYESQGYAKDAVYEADQHGNFNPDRPVVDPVGSLTCDIPTAAAGLAWATNFKSRIETNGTYTTSGREANPNIARGECKEGPRGEVYALGHYLNYANSSPPAASIVSVDNAGTTEYYQAKMNHISWAFNSPLSGLSGIFWEQLDPPTAEQVAEATVWATPRSYEATGTPQIQLVFNAIRIAVAGFSSTGTNVRFGAMTYGDNNTGGKVLAPIQDLVDHDDPADLTLLNNFLATLPQDPDTDLLNSNSARPACGSMADALAYYQGVRLPASNQTSMTPNSNYPSPIEFRCQPNYIIYITNGMNNESLGSSLETSTFHVEVTLPDGTTWAPPCGDFDGDLEEMDPNDTTQCDASYGTAGYSYLDDFAKRMAEYDVYDDDESIPASEGDQTIRTATILAFQQQEDLLAAAGDDNHGQGGHFQAYTANELAGHLTDLLSNIVREANASFIAPVVPASPENRVRSGRRIYLGFFKPIEQAMWWGNLKKYIIDNEGEVLALSDPNDPSTTVPFDTADSYELWNKGGTGDEGAVEGGGVGALVQARAVAETRKIYTFLGTDVDLRANVNAVTEANALVSAELRTHMEITATEAEKYLNFVHGQEQIEPGRVEPREWALGDILHSKPNIFNYNIYDFDVTAEETPPETNDATNFPYGDWNLGCSTANKCNKTVIFVGSNDGMLHAFADHNGEELWGYIPPNLLPYIKNLTGNTHDYFVDGTPIIYSRDQDGDGNYDPSHHDRVIMLFGTRRGGGIESLDETAPRGAYHALDVTDATRPKFLFSVDNKHLVRYDGSSIDGVSTPVASGLDELGETFSSPFVRRIRVDGNDIIAMFVGAGYDNNEDLRWGSTQNFPLDHTKPLVEDFDTTSGSSDYTVATSHEAGNPVYSNTAGFGCGGSNCGQVNPRGRGLYVIEIARVSTCSYTDHNGDLQSNVECRDFSNAGDKIWGYTGDGNHTAVAGEHVVDASMDFSFAADLRVIDADENGLADRIYALDTGGGLWRFDIGNNDRANWTGKKIFDANDIEADGTADSSDGSVGRKFFYTPDYDRVDANQVNLFFSSGDRAHPLNYLDHNTANGATTDRIYMVKDFDNPPISHTPAPIISEDTTDDYLVDLTVDAPLSLDTTFRLENAPWANNGTVDGSYGWFMKLLAAPGEKALSPPQEVLGLLLQTTYTPNINITDPCEAGNQGVSRFYALKALTGEGFLDFNGDNVNDRSMVVGGGIPPEPTIIVTATGVKAIIISEDSALGQTPKTKLTGVDVGDIETIVPVYWMQW